MLLTECKNPWENISCIDYENHMSHPSVMQLQTLNQLFKQQYRDYLPKKLIYIGVCTGNGLEHIDNNITEKVIGIDINEDFIKICANRFDGKISNLELFQIDINKNLLESEKADLIISNLVLEFIDTDRFFKQISLFENGKTVNSIIFQIKNKVPVVSNSGVNALKVLANFNQEIKLEELQKRIKDEKFVILKQEKFLLPDGKEFIRVDFKKNF